MLIEFFALALTSPRELCASSTTPSQELCSSLVACTYRRLLRGSSGRESKFARISNSDTTHLPQDYLQSAKLDVCPCVFRRTLEEVPVHFLEDLAVRFLEHLVPAVEILNVKLMYSEETVCASFKTGVRKMAKLLLMQKLSDAAHVISKFEQTKLPLIFIYQEKKIQKN
jgi:hypothetical protein